MSSGDTWAVMPVKPFRLAKQRLACVLNEDERMGLARVMLEDVLSALDGCSHRLAGVIVVTADEDASTVARQHDAIVFREVAAIGMNSALTRVVNHVSGRPGTGVVVVPADLPHVSPSDIDAMLDLIRCAPAVALVRANDGGTNLMACRPAAAIAPAFGPDSFYAHCVAATRSRITPTVRFAPHLQFDIDRPDDLVAFMARVSATRTYAHLSKLKVQERLQDEPSVANRQADPNAGMGVLGHERHDR
jgi:2-phospho-L-lactate/phosphoenolpyruvate guanylyltransferase